MDFDHVWLKKMNLAPTGRQPMHFVVISVFHVLCIHVVEFFNFVSYFIGKAQMSILRQKEWCLTIVKMEADPLVMAE